MRTELVFKPGLLSNCASGGLAWAQCCEHYEVPLPTNQCLDAELTVRFLHERLCVAAWRLQSVLRRGLRSWPPSAATTAR